MITICYLNNKGGVGKTATVSTIGHMMNQDKRIGIGCHADAHRHRADGPDPEALCL